MITQIRDVDPENIGAQGQVTAVVLDGEDLKSYQTMQSRIEALEADLKEVTGDLIFLKDYVDMEYFETCKNSVTSNNGDILYELNSVLDTDEYNFNRISYIWENGVE